MFNVLKVNVTHSKMETEREVVKVLTWLKWPLLVNCPPTHTHMHTCTPHMHTHTTCTHTHRSSYNNTKWLHERSDRGGTHRYRCISWWPPNLWHPQPQTNQDYHPNSKNDDTGRLSVCLSVCLYLYMSVPLFLCSSVPLFLASFYHSISPVFFLEM